LIYENKSESIIEADFYFSISSSACFDQFQAKIGDKIMKGIIKERIAAEK